MNRVNEERDEWGIKQSDWNRRKFGDKLKFDNVRILRNPCRRGADFFFVTILVVSVTFSVGMAGSWMTLDES